MTTTPAAPAALAAACRTLADELERGEGPELDVDALFRDDGSPCCAGGYMLSLAGCRENDVCALVDTGSLDTALKILLRSALSSDVVSACVRLTTANDNAIDAERQRAVIAPLRALADALDKEAT